MHLAALLRRSGGFPTTGNNRASWDAARDNPEYR